MAMFMQAMAQFINDELLLLTREKLNKKLVLFSKCTPEMKEQHPLLIESFYTTFSQPEMSERCPALCCRALLKV